MITDDQDDHYCWSIMITDHQWWPMMIPDDQWWSLMIADDQWWLLVISDDHWWLLMINDDYWWSMMIIDDYWWSLMITDDQWWILTPKYSKHVVLSKGACPTNPGTNFMGKKNACGNAVGGIVLVKMTSKLMELGELSIWVELGTDLGHWGEFVRRKMMIEVCRTREGVNNLMPDLDPQHHTWFHMI